MTEEVKKKGSKKLSLRKSTLETFVSSTARGVMNAKERLKQKKEKVIHAVPFLEKIDRRIKDFDSKMEQKYGQVYVKLRDSAKNIARTVLAAKLFGIPGIVGICAYKQSCSAFPELSAYVLIKRVKRRCLCWNRRKRQSKTVKQRVFWIIWPKIKGKLILR